MSLVEPAAEVLTDVVIEKLEEAKLKDSSASIVFEIACLFFGCLALAFGLGIVSGYCIRAFR